MKNLIIPILLLLAATACSGGEKTAEKKVDLAEDQSPRLAGVYPHVNLTAQASVISEYKALIRRYMSVVFMAKTEIGNMYIFSDQEKYRLPNGYNEMGKKFMKIGLTDSKGNRMLECKYDQIGNPGGIAAGCMELKSEGKYGLYNYKTDIIIAPQFDVIFPSEIMGYVAIGKKGDQYFKLYEDGTTKLIKNEAEIPTYQKLGEKANFDIADEKIGFWIDLLELEGYVANPIDMDDVSSFATGKIFTPSYLAELKVLPAFIEYISMESMGVERLVTKTEIVKPRNKKVDSFLEYFHEIGSDARGFETENRHLVTVDKKNKVLDSKLILDGNGGVCNNARYKSVTFLNDSLIEVKSSLNEYEAHPVYYTMTIYSYFEISADGKIIPFHPDCFFEMASKVKLKDAHFKGCFARYIESAESENEYGAQNNTSLTKHLSLYDLEYMRNEIFARHGYIFTDPAWKAVFAAKKWYKGTSKNVDKKLTALEKANIQFIKAYEIKMKDNESKFTQPEETFFMES